jgi:hypothetical protein
MSVTAIAHIEHEYMTLTSLVPLLSYLGRMTTSFRESMQPYVFTMLSLANSETSDQKHGNFHSQMLKQHHP